MRIVALSDLHGFLPDVQPCDLLIVAGDLCPDRLGLMAERSDAAWFAASPRCLGPRVATWAIRWCGQVRSRTHRQPDLDSGRVEHVGSRELLAAIERIRPRVVICGHVHGGFGRYEHLGIPIYNVSVVDERYRLVNAPTVIELPDV